MTGRLEACIRLAKSVGIKNKRVLDVGCSYPWFLEFAQKNGAKMIAGIEPDSIKVQAAKKQVPKAKILQGHAGDLKFPNKSFDLVTLFDVIEHVPSNTEITTLKEINRVLVVGGHLIISTPFANWLSQICDPAWYFGHRHYSEDRLTQMLHGIGFKVKSVVIHGGMWEIVGMWILYISKWIFRRPMPFEEWFDLRRRDEFKKQGWTHLFLTAIKENE